MSGSDDEWSVFLGFGVRSLFGVCSLIYGQNRFKLVAKCEWQRRNIYARVKKNSPELFVSKKIGFFF